MNNINILLEICHKIMMKENKINGLIIKTDRNNTS